ncbi:MAG TPA: glycosyl hydrolase family 8 [Mycobacterium sp.]|nr:glycosyl hydrolase family 8 [Mycobacterium sp.]
MRADLLLRWVAGLLAVAFVGLSSGCGGSSESASTAGFLDRYVRDSGAVVRTDQGGDVVSEGQAYAMVLADIAGEWSTVRSVWKWTSTHLQRPDGLLSWHAKPDGTVLDPQSAADADVLAAWALLDYRGPSPDALTAAGKQLAAAVLAHETVPVGGRRVLAAGPWAVTASPPMVNPSYWMPSVFRSLAAATGDARWKTLADTSVRQLSALTSGGQQLPPDWAQVKGAALVPTGAADGSGSPSYGLDAARAPVWLAADCTAASRDLAGHLWTLLRDRSDTTPLSKVAAAASARAAGADGAASQAMKDAEALAQDHPTYYGDAWVALGTAMQDGRPPAC